ncbi:DUF3048 domain-containing protein [Candidatus Uhrbacteria bacterium]|nr:DUF3048 domain-containing protein [Candidatus Uhrbacteria bacterium]
MKKTHLRQGFGGRADRLTLVGLLLVIGLAVLVALVLPKFVYRSFVQKDGAQDTAMVALYRHPLTGMSLYEPLQELPQVFAVMVDNHEEAWPPSGIDQAFLVIEAPVEAAIPRLLAFFDSKQVVEEIGPVRSARPYFLDWANELDALYAHVGGSNAALDAIASGGTFDFNQYWWGEYFWRAGNRYAPHNVFTSTALMNEFVALRTDAGVAPERLYDVWLFKDPEPSQKESSVHVDFDGTIYTADWEYDVERGVYLRFQSDAPHLTSTGVQITADNVAVVVTDIEVLDNVGRRSVRTTGEGEAVVYQDGTMIEATWEKPSASERLKFYKRDSGEEILMNAGVTWIEVVDEFTQE